MIREYTQHHKMSECRLHDERVDLYGVPHFIMILKNLLKGQSYY
jgi:hypothetical protein